MNNLVSTQELLTQLRINVAEVELAQEEAREDGFILAAKYLERRNTELQVKIAELEESF